jgi:hypothetical protein
MKPKSRKKELLEFSFGSLGPMERELELMEEMKRLNLSLLNCSD